MADPNPVFGFSIVKEKSYVKDCKPYKSTIKNILRTELDIVGWPEKSQRLHGPLSGRCSGLLHARVDIRLRILYKPDYGHKIIFLRRLLNHNQIDDFCG